MIDLRRLLLELALEGAAGSSRIRKVVIETMVDIEDVQGAVQ